MGRQFTVHLHPSRFPHSCDDSFGDSCAFHPASAIDVECRYRRHHQSGHPGDSRGQRCICHGNPDQSLTRTDTCPARRRNPIPGLHSPPNPPTAFRHFFPQGMEWGSPLLSHISIIIITDFTKNLHVTEHQISLLRLLLMSGLLPEKILNILLHNPAF